MGVLAVSKPWPMSPPLNPSDFPGANPHAVQATVITNYLRGMPEEGRSSSSDRSGTSPNCVRNRDYFIESSSSPSSGGRIQMPVIQTPGGPVPVPVQIQSPGHNQRHSSYQRVPMIVNANTPPQPPLYETVRPKSAFFDEIEELNSKMKACRKLEAEFAMEVSHQRQRSDHVRPTVPPPLPPGRPASANSASANNGIVTRAEAHLLQPPTTPTCVPWLKKIKMVKKIKRKIGIGGSKSGTSFNNLPPLNFNAVHGENIQIFHQGTVAKRINSFCKAIAFTDRPVKVNEKVCIKLIEISTNWSGVLRFGFTSQDPNLLRNTLPKYVCPDLTSRPGVWAKAFSDNLVKKDSILNFHVNSAGEIHFGIDGDDKGMFLSGVDTRAPLWAVFDIYGNTTAVELVDCRAHLNNRPSLSLPESPASTRCPAQQQQQQQRQDSSSSLPKSCQSSYSSVRYCHGTPSAIRSQIHLQPSQQLQHFVSARSLPDQTQLYSTPYNGGGGGYGQSQISVPKISASYLPVPLPVKSTSDFHSGNNNRQPLTNGPSTRPLSSHILSSSSPSSNHSQQPSSVYKTPPCPKPVRDDYESLYLVKQSMSVKPGPGPCSAGLSNYVSIPNLVKIRPEAMPYSSSTSKIETAVSSGSPSKEQPAMSLECLACCERPVDSVFYSCGHMCMCFQCAVDYWRTKEKGHCPICRAAINDVIRTYT